MGHSRQFVAILTSSPALSSILSMVLDCEEHLNVQSFDRPNVLKTHLRIAPVDLIICDYEIGETLAPQLAIDMRRQLPTRQFQMIVLSNFISAELKQSCNFAAIDEVIVKPMSPLFLRDRVVARLEKTDQSRDSLLTQENTSIQAIPAIKVPDNVVPLFPPTEPTYI